MQATIVALYGEKLGDLLVFISECQKLVAELLGRQFRKYEIDQIHATMVGLERDQHKPQKFLNRNFMARRDVQVKMDFRGLLTYIRDGGNLPFQLQIGGFQNRDYPFVSRGMRPFSRSFTIQNDNVVVMGWPLRGLPLAKPPATPTALIQESRLYPMTLDSMRRSAQRYGVLHAYHGKPEDIDNDFFFRIGKIEDYSSVDDLLKSRVENTMRDFMAAMSPLIVNIDLRDLDVVFYDSEELPTGSSIAYSLDDKDLNESSFCSRF